MPSADANDQTRFRRLLKAGYGCIRVVTLEEDYVLELLRDATLSLGRDLWIWTATGGVRDGMIAQSAPLGDTDKFENLCRFMVQSQRKPIFALLDANPHLNQPRNARALRDAISAMRDVGKQIVLIDSDENCPTAIQGVAAVFEPSLPDAEELERLLRLTLRSLHRDQPIAIDLTRSELQTIVRNLQGLTRIQAAGVVGELVAEDKRLDGGDVSHVMAAKRRLLAGEGLLEFIETPGDLSGIGGLRRLKDWLAQRERALTDEAAAFGIDPPRGVLMLGVQGAGKSLCAKAIAAAWQRPLLRMDVGSLFDRYVGESERRLRQALHQAERMSPIILWIDEIEKAFASAAAQSTDGGLSKRMFGCLLTWMQEHAAPVFLVATANDIEALPPELLRKGRFDEIFFVDLPAEDVRREIFSIHLKRRGRDPSDYDLAALSAAADGYSGAEIEQSVVSALHDAFSAGQQLADQHVLAALERSPPLSVTMAEKVATLRAWAAGRCVPAD